MMQALPTLAPGSRQFLISLQMAIFVHVLMFFVWGLFPHNGVNTLPVKTLNIRIGSAAEFLGRHAEGGGQSSSASSSAPAASTPAPQISKPATMNASLPKLAPPAQQPAPQAPAVQAPPKAAAVEKRPAAIKEINEEDLKKELSQPAAEPAATPIHAAAPQEASRLVRNRSEAAAQAPAGGEGAGGAGTAAGAGTGGAGAGVAPTAQEAEAMARYEQVLSVWLQRHKKYPPEARAQGMEGQAVLRLRIDRMGNIKFYRIQQRTGHEVLDRAALEMVRRANPVPPVPADYPAGSLLEFLVPVHFTLR